MWSPEQSLQVATDMQSVVLSSFSACRCLSRAKELHLPHLEAYALLCLAKFSLRHRRTMPQTASATQPGMPPLGAFSLLEHNSDVCVNKAMIQGVTGLHCPPFCSDAEQLPCEVQGSFSLSVE